MRGVAVAAVAGALAVLTTGCGGRHTHPSPRGVGTEQLRITAAGRAAAKAAVLHQAELNPNYVGGLVQPPPDPHEDVPCAGRGIFAPKQSDLVVRGAAESDFTIAGVVELDSAVQLVQTPQMAVVGWKRWTRPAFVRCWRAQIASPATVIDAIGRVPLPRVGAFSAEYRAVYGVPGDGEFTEVDDTILIASACSRIHLYVTTDRKHEQAITRVEREVAAILARASAKSCAGNMA